MANENAVLAEAIQMGMETDAGTAVPATFKWPGKGLVKFLDQLEEHDYATGEAGGAIEDDDTISKTGTVLTLSDTVASYELLIWLLNMGIKAVAGPATSFTFALPTLVTPNAIKTFTWEFASARQEYEFPYGFARKIGIHGNAEQNGGLIYCNAEIEGRKSSASTATASLGHIASREAMNLRSATLKVDALGTAFGTAAALSNCLREINVDVETGWVAKGYAASRSDKDFAVAEGGGVGYKLTGSMLLAFTADVVTELANARAGTGRIVEVAVSGTGSRAFKFQLPLKWKPQDVGMEEDSGMRLLRLPFISKYSRTSVAQGPQFVITASASTTVS